MSRHREQGETEAVDLASRFCRPWKAMSAGFLTNQGDALQRSGWLPEQPPGLQEAVFTEHLGCASIL